MRRRLEFTAPVVVPLSPSVRMIRRPRNSISLHGVYIVQYCQSKGIDNGKAALFFLQRLQESLTGKTSVSHFNNRS